MTLFFTILKSNETYWMAKFDMSFIPGDDHNHTSTVSDSSLNICWNSVSQREISFVHTNLKSVCILQIVKYIFLHKWPVMVAKRDNVIAI